MKLTRARIENFKGVREVEINFNSPHPPSPRPITALLGDNGSGKTSVLQAIALTLSLVTRKTPNASDLEWHGFLAERLGTLGQTRVELDVQFEADELMAISELFTAWKATQSSAWLESHRIVPPGQFPNVHLVFEKGGVRCREDWAGFNQFRGRYYIKTLLRSQPEIGNYFDRVGDVFWFDQHRNLGTGAVDLDEPQRAAEGMTLNERTRREDSKGWTAGVEQLRKELVRQWLLLTSGNPSRARLFLREAERQFASVFPGTRFQTIAPRSDYSSRDYEEFFFLLERDGKLFDISEMSSGEQAVFPLIYEFAKFSITRSVVLIDELELHLHPPQQQALLGALRKLGVDCQFLVTTHSPYLADVIPQEHKLRLPGGRECL